MYVHIMPATFSAWVTFLPSKMKEFEMADNTPPVSVPVVKHGFLNNKIFKGDNNKKLKKLKSKTKRKSLKNKK